MAVRVPDHLPEGHGDCNCRFLCSGHPGCIACWVYDIARCVWQCYNPDGTNVYTAVTVAEDDKVGLDRRVDLRVNGVALGEVGKLLAELANADIYVPADRIDEPQDLYLEDASLDTAVRELNLMAVERP